MAGLNAAVMAKIQGNQVAAAAMEVTRQRMAAQAQGGGLRPRPDSPVADLDKAAK
jgi:hypothetical protein